MQNRDAGIALCGVVIGVLLGAGSLLYAQGASLGADSQDVAYKRITPRDVIQQQLKSHAAGTVQKGTQAANTVAAPSADCMTATAVVKELMSKVNYWIPNNLVNTQRRSEISKAGDAIIVRYCPAPATSMKKDASTTNMKAAAPVKIHNDCTVYEQGSTRYNKCKASNAKNKVYTGDEGAQ